MKIPHAVKGALSGVAVLAVAGLVAACGATSTPEASISPATGTTHLEKVHAQAKAEPAAPRMTAGQRNALATARDYLDTSAFSKPGLIKQLRYEHFSSADARWAAAHVKVSWMAQAVKAARDYLDTQSFSRSGLLQQLDFEGFTPSQATHGVAVAYH